MLALEWVGQGVFCLGQNGQDLDVAGKLEGEV